MLGLTSLLARPTFLCLRCIISFNDKSTHSSFYLPFNRPNRCGGCAVLRLLGLKMIRTIWLATICLAVLSTLAVGKAVMTRTPSSAPERPADLTTTSTGLTQDTLGKADRLEITYVP